MVLKRTVRRAIRRTDKFLARHLDEEGVVFFQVFVYLHMAVAGLYGLFIARGIPAGLSSEIPPHSLAQTIWLWLFVFGALTLTGRVLVSCRYAGNRASIYTCGAWLQFTGDLAMAWGFLGYVIASWGGVYWGKESVAAFGFAAYFWCAFFLVVRDIRRIMQAERAVRR